MADNKDGDLTDTVIENIVKKAYDAQSRAYCPYSKFPVGAALLCHDGKIFTGCNVENAILPLGICAERTAIVKAVSDGYTRFRAVALACGVMEGPCGSCRQSLAEFGLNLDIYLTDPKDFSWKKYTLAELLPLAFTADKLPK